MTENEFRNQCPKMFDDINANLKTYWFYNGSISLTTHSFIQQYSFIEKIENEKYMIYFKFSFNKQLMPQNLN